MDQFQSQLGQECFNTIGCDTNTGYTGVSLSVEQGQEQDLVIQLQAELLDALQQKEDAFFQIKKLQDKLRASEDTVKQLKKKLKSLSQTLVEPSPAVRRSSRKKKGPLKQLDDVDKIVDQLDMPSPEQTPPIVEQKDYDSGVCCAMELEDCSLSVMGTKIKIENDFNGSEDVGGEDDVSNLCGDGRGSGDGFGYNEDSVHKVSGGDVGGDLGVHKKRKMLPKGDNGERIRPKCPICCRVCWDYSKLEQHMRLHTGEKPFHCTLCDKTFRLKFQLVQHTRGHKEEKRYICFVCGKGFGVSSVLWVHMRSHTGKKSYECSICPKSFYQSAHLSQHMRTHTGQKPFECPVCPKTFNQKAHLIQHQRMHSGEKPFQCFTCGRTFSCSSHLSRHMKIHTGEKPHQCKICSRSFTDSAYLTRHMTTHTSEKPHECSVCQKSFRVKYNLTQHMRTHNGVGKIKQRL